MVVKVVPELETLVVMMEAITLVSDGDNVVMMFDSVDSPVVALLAVVVSDGLCLIEGIVVGGGSAHVF